MAVKLKAAKREDLRSSVTKQLRDSGQIPAVVYGKDEEAQAISIDSLALMKTVRDEGRNAVISLLLADDSAVDVMLHEYQMHPLKNQVIHADFYTIDLTEEMDVEVPLHLEGEAQGSKDGGILQQPLYELQVRAKPNAIPEEITVDIGKLEIGDSLTVADLPTSEEYEFLDESDTTIVTVLPPEAEEETEEEEADTSVEPELVGADEEEEETEE